MLLLAGHGHNNASKKGIIMQKLISSLIIATGFVAAAAHAQVSVQDPWTRATVAQQKATGAFMQLSSPKSVKLVSASSPLTPTVEVHEMAIQGEVMRMRQVQSVQLSAGKTVELKPGGYHIMLMNLKSQVKEGDVVPLTLIFENQDGSRQTLDVKAPVRALNHASQQSGH